MAKQFKLLFSGAIASDQHQAVVRGKLQALLKISDEQTEVMFSGKPVIVKKSADEATAKRYQGAFAKAGAVLEVVAVADSADSQPVAQPAQSKSEAGAAPNPAPGATPFELAPAGSDLLAPGERREVQAVQVATDHLSLAFPGQDLSDVDLSQAVPPPPNTDHLVLDAPGVLLSDAEEASIESAVMAVEFELAKVGARLRESAEDGPEPAAPDTSHLTLAELTPAD